jgi:hypothetical protein
MSLRPGNSIERRPGRHPRPIDHPCHEVTLTPHLQAQIQTDRASRYLVQLCKHAAAMGATRGHGLRNHLPGRSANREVQVRAEYSDSRGTVIFTPWGRCTMTATPTTLTVDIEATDPDNLQRVRDIVTRDLDRFSHRNPLTITWSQPGIPDVAEPGSAP